MDIRVLTFLLLITAAHSSMEEVIEVIKLSQAVVEQVLGAWGEIHEELDAEALPTLALLEKAVKTVDDQNEKIVLGRLDHITRTIQRLERRIDQSNAVAMLLARTAGTRTNLQLGLREMITLLDRVALYDRRMRSYLGLQNFLERSTLEDFAEWCVSHNPLALPGQLEGIHALIVPPNEKLLGRSILDLILDDIQEDHPNLCNYKMSTHQLIYDMYNTIALTEIKGFAIMQFSWMLLRIYGKGNFTYEASLARKRYEERNTLTADAVRAALYKADRDLYACDQEDRQLGQTYEEVTRLLQGYVANEVDIHSGHSCWKGCSHFQRTDHKSCQYSSELCGKQAACKGRIMNCKFIDSKMWVCRAGQNSNRRYEWIQFENGKQFGNIGSCDRGTTKVDSWRSWVFWQCSYCMCICEEYGPYSDRYFNLWDTTSDIQKNKVVTGLQIVKEGQVFYLQIRQGKLGKRGSITNDELVPLRTFTSDDDIKYGVDYHMLSYEKRAIDLNKLQSPPGHVLTGVRFRMSGSHLHLEIRSTPFNYTTGRLSPQNSQWIYDTEDSEFPRSQLKLIKPDIPTRSATPLPVDSKHDQYVEFTHSDFEADAAQSTVPFIDIQPLNPSKGSPLLSGAGLYHRGAPYSGGFIAAKLVTYDYSPHIVASPLPSTV
ncbi:uncharacterized protein LOC120628861 [Pararge aegeria]|uniref:uncharacterized protein LOC120628861 n=1 Tax=Pararge aegeria TaxID=116150 RepID=UPI0019D1D3CC|nr:uncharacterized protein LOC120628861 [Pararge aegeria]